MPGCSAINCNNSSAKGFLMKRIPKDPVRRQDWVARIKRGGWTVTDNSCLCEVHFPPEMWEKTRQDGSRRLRTNAVPTIFSFCPSPSSHKESPIEAEQPVKAKPFIEEELPIEEESDFGSTVVS